MPKSPIAFKGESYHSFLRK